MLKAICTSFMLISSLYSITGYRECRQPNYLTKDGKIFAVDTESGVETNIKLKGVTWKGMETENMIPEGLWGTSMPNEAGTRATTISNLIEFLKNNSFNSIRLPLNAEYINNDEIPQLSFIHSYENKELTTFTSEEITAKDGQIHYLDLIARIVQTLQDEKISVLLDIHSLSIYSQDAYWYTAPYVNITESATYKAVTYLAKTLCGPTQWNILGIDFKNEMTDVTWGTEGTDIETDWQQAATILANQVIEICPKWLVFLGGASGDANDYQYIEIEEMEDKKIKFWDGGNLQNATTNPIQMQVPNKLVYAPHAHAHGKYPQNYFYTPDSNCSTKIEDLGIEESDISECVDFINGEKVESKMKCYGDETIGCASYTHLSPEALQKTYKNVLSKAFGDIQQQTPKNALVLGAFSGVYGKSTQPRQTIILDTLIEMASSSSFQGGYFHALNPDTEYYTEDLPDNKKSGLFGRTHYGLFSMKSWQTPNEDLLKALSAMPSTSIPCYGNEDEDSLAITSTISITLYFGVLVLCIFGL